MSANFASASDPYTPPSNANFSGSGDPYTPPPWPDETPPERLRLKRGVAWGAGQSMVRQSSMTAGDAAPMLACTRIDWGDTLALHGQSLAAPWIVSVLQAPFLTYAPEPASSADLLPTPTYAGFAGSSAAYIPPTPADFTGTEATASISVIWHDVPAPGSYVHDSQAAVAWGDAEPAGSPVTAAWGDGIPVDAATAQLWGTGTPADKRVALLWAEGEPFDAERAAEWSEAGTLDLASTAAWRSAYLLSASRGAEPYTPEPAASVPLLPTPTYAGFAGSSAAYIPPTPADFTGTEATASISVIWAQAADVAPQDGARNTDRPWRVVWGRGQSRDRRPALIWQTEDPAPGDGLPDTVPTQESYTVASTLNVVRLPERTPVNVIGARASLAMGDFAWRASIAIADKAGLDLLNPSSGRKEAEIEINGFAVWVIVESWSQQSVFGQVAWVAQCRGISAELDEPYSSPRNFLSTGNAAASQLALDELSGTGWTRAWSAVDWTLTAGQFFYSGRTPIRAIAGLAATPGAFVRPDANDKNLVIMSQLPHKPDDWSGETPDAIIPQSITTSLSDAWQPAPAYNYVQVSGGTQGVLVKATKQGTSGDNPRSDIVDPYCTHSDVGQERGRVEIYGSGNAALSARQMPILAGIGVRLPGELMRNDDTAGTWFGLVKTTAIYGAWQDDGLRCWMDLEQDRRDL